MSNIRHAALGIGKPGTRGRGLHSCGKRRSPVRGSYPERQGRSPGLLAQSARYPERFTAFRERPGRLAFPPVIALGLSVALVGCDVT
jgi:hypothetical protein